ncbi:MAG TPA: hypothetical protein VIU29_03680 [Candidatus Deferrimicrobiaceae bacterium]
MTRLSRLIPILVLAVAFLGWETYRARIEPPVDVNAGAPDGRAGADGVDNTAESAAAADLASAVSQITARPLLRPDRQPYKEMPFVTAAPQRNYEAEMGAFTVLGILPIDGREKAIVVGKGAKGSGERWELGEGDSLPGFVVKAIRPDGVSLAADGKEFLLPLYAGGPKASGSPLRTELPPSQGTAPGGAGVAAQPPQAAGRGILPAALPASPAAPAYQPGQPYPAPAYGGGNVRRRPPVMPSRPLPTSPTQ